LLYICSESKLGFEAVSRYRALEHASRFIQQLLLVQPSPTSSSTISNDNSEAKQSEIASSSSASKPFQLSPLLNRKGDDAVQLRRTAAEAVRFMYILCAIRTAEELAAVFQGDVVVKHIQLLVELLAHGVVDEQTPQTATHDSDELKNVELKSVSNAEDDGMTKGSGPADVSLFDLKILVSNLIICCPKAGFPLLSRKMNCITFLLKSLAKTLQEQDDSDNINTEDLCPKLLILSAVVKNDETCRQYIKSQIFGKYANATQEQLTGKAKVDNMRPDGDDDDDDISPDGSQKFSLRKSLLDLITSMDWNVKQLVSDFLFDVCGQQSDEYIRLTGFGNAVALLTEKGLPGFTSISSKTLTLEDMLSMQSERKGK
jgi:hypothetical protein